jgi:hypothetical protein
MSYVLPNPEHPKSGGKRMPDCPDRGLQFGPALTRLYGRLPTRVQIEKLKGDASTRSYFRLTVGHEDPSGQDGELRPRSLVAMQLPADALRSDEATGGERPAELPFLDVQRLLARRGVPVPEVYLSDLGNGVVLLEDLGDETLAARLERLPRAAWPAMYEQAVDLLVRLHLACERSEPGCIAYGRRFDRELIRWEIDHFREWGLHALYGPPDSDQGAALERGFEQVVQAMLAMPVGFVHRDYQSRNLIWARRSAGEQLVVIDFQDALQGPVPYDLVALLCDSYQALDLELQQQMIERYLRGRQFAPAAADRFRQAFWIVAVHRKLKDAGRFVFIDRVRGNPGFLAHYPQSLLYVGRALGQLGGFSGMYELLCRLIPGFPEQVQQPGAATALGGCSPGTTG